MKLISDKDWLDKVLLAADVYKKDIAQYGSHKQEIDRFVEWLYKQYGVVMPHKTKALE